MKTKGIKLFTLSFSLIILVCANFVFSQDDYQKWLDQQNNDYQNFVTEQDQQFLQFLEKEWKQFKLSQGLIPDEKPKPVQLPEAEPEGIPEDLLPEKPIIIKELPSLGQLSEGPPPFIEKPVTKPKPSEKLITFDYFGTRINIAIEKQLLSLQVSSIINKEAIGDFWEKVSKINTGPLLETALNYKEKLHLNDWAFCLLLNNLCKQIYPSNENKQKLLVWHLLVKSGFDIRVGYADKVILLIPANEPIYGVQYFNLDGKRYYSLTMNEQLDENIGSIYTYEGSYPAAVSNIDMKVNHEMSLQNKEIVNTIEFRYQDKNYKFDIRLNKNLISFYGLYPQTSFDVYFSADMSLPTSNDLITALANYLLGKSQVEAVNFLLHFVQFAFKYQTDQEQFGKEKPLFAEETLFYPYSDCEDRSVLFAYLTKKILGLQVIGLDYPGHIATAVRFNTLVNGDSVTFQGDKYIICDPTFINANVGKCMPKYKKVKPGIISL